jgi:hypothetical protein
MPRAAQDVITAWLDGRNKKGRKSQNGNYIISTEDGLLYTYAVVMGELKSDGEIILHEVNESVTSRKHYNMMFREVLGFINSGLQAFFGRDDVEISGCPHYNHRQDYQVNCPGLAVCLGKDFDNKKTYVIPPNEARPYKDDEYFNNVLKKRIGEDETVKVIKQLDKFKVLV